MKKLNFRKSKERGSLTVEAVLFLVPFMLAFLTLLNVARYVEAEMLIHHSITQTAKQVSTYSYLLTKSEISKEIQETTKKSKEFETDTKETINSVTTVFTKLKSFDMSDPVNSVDDVVTAAGGASDALTDYFSDPEAILSGAMAMAQHGAESAILTTILGGISGANLKNALATVTDDPDLYLERIGVVDGLDGLNYEKSEWMSNESGKPNLKIVVTYKMKNLIFPLFDFGEIDCSQCASTLIW